MRTRPLSKSASVLLDSSGNGTASIGPTGVGESWTVTNVSVSVATNTSEAVCRTYAGAAASQRYFIGGTTWGSTGDNNVLSAVVKGGSQVFAVWEGGDSGAKATVTVTGTRQVT